MSKMTSNATNALFDANIWLAQCHAAHGHHATVLAALREIGAGVFCRVTQMALLRLLTRVEIMGPDLVTPAVAWQYYHQLCQEGGAVFLEEPAGLAETWQKFSANLPAASGSSWTDAYLAAFAKCAGLQLVTFDRCFKRFAGLNCRVL
jgi:toxin-antitoxin system PIN domain toxin